MPTREIPRDEWVAFLNVFSKQHQGERATVEVIGSDVGDQEEARALPFVGVSADKEGSDAGSIMFMLGTEPEDHVEHMIRFPRHLRVKSEGDVTQDALEVEDADGNKTILTLQLPPQLP